MPNRSTPALLAGLAALAACASGDPQPGGASTPPPPVEGSPRAATRACAPLFVSPAGEPFRSDPDAASADAASPNAATRVCPLRAWFSRADADGDGALTRTEFRDDALRFFATLDVNGDGYIDGLELQRYEQRVVPEILGRSPGPYARDGGGGLIPVRMQIGGGGGGGGRGGGGLGGGGSPSDDGGSSRPKDRLQGGAGLARFGLLGEPEPVAAADLNFDGRISRDEFATRATQRFASLDEAEAGRLVYPDLERRLQAHGRDGRGGGGAGAGAGGGARRRGGGGRGGGGSRGPQT